MENRIARSIKLEEESILRINPDYQSRKKLIAKCNLLKRKNNRLKMKALRIAEMEKKRLERLEKQVDKMKKEIDEQRSNQDALELDMLKNEQKRNQIENIRNVHPEGYDMLLSNLYMGGVATRQEAIARNTVLHLNGVYFEPAMDGIVIVDRSRLYRLEPLQSEDQTCYICLRNVNCQKSCNNENCNIGVCFTCHIKLAKSASKCPVCREDIRFD